jgi:hypothetical protein
MRKNKRMKLQKKETTRYKAQVRNRAPERGLKKEEQRSEQDHRQTGERLNADPSGGAVGRCWGRSTASGGRWEQGRGGSGTHGISAESLEGVST